MWERFWAWLSDQEPKPLEGENIYETILNQLENLHELKQKRFMAPKARTVILLTNTESIGELRELLIESSVFVSKQEYLSERWKLMVIRPDRRTLEHYITDADDLIHPLDWLVLHQHYIIKLVNAFLLMEKADAEYYQRYCNFVIEDILALVKASRECVQ